MTKRRGYHQLVDGEWFRPRMRGGREMCCSCALVHKVDYRIVDGRVEFRAVQQKRATANARRPFKFEREAE